MAQEGCDLALEEIDVQGIDSGARASVKYLHQILDLHPHHQTQGVRFKQLTCTATTTKRVAIWPLKKRSVLFRCGITKGKLESHFRHISFFTQSQIRPTIKLSSSHSLFLNFVKHAHSLLCLSGMSYPTCPVDVLSVLPYSSLSPVVSQLEPISYSPSALESWTPSCWLGLSSWRLSCSFSLSSCSLLLWCLQVFLLPEPLQVYISGLHLSSTSIWISSGSGFSGSAE